MISSAPVSLQKDLRTLFSVGSFGVLTDSELLARFTAGAGDEASEAAFEVLVARHGPMVLGACRRILRDADAADDAFQATFLILARKADRVRVDDSLGRWLHGVSVKVARRARSQAGRNRAYNLGSVEPAAVGAAVHDVEVAELRALIDIEIERLPSRYRTVVSLCYLQGFTQEQAASRLKCPVGTVQSRLHRARERLRRQLTRRGLTQNSFSSAMLAQSTARIEVPFALIQSTTSVALSVLRGAVGGIVSAKVVQLASNSFGGMIMSKGIWAGALVVLVSVSASSLLVQAIGGDEPKKPAAEPKQVQDDAKPTVADKFAKIKAEFEAQQALLRDAVEKASDEREQSRLYSEMSPDDVIFSRRMVDLALEAPKEEAARDALIWVINKPYRGDEGPYGDEFGRAAALLVRHHGDDPIAVSVGLGLENTPSVRRESLLFGFYASAKSSEAKGLARLALGRYLMAKPKPIAGSPRGLVRQKLVYKNLMGEDGVRRDKTIELSDERYAYQLITRLNDPKATMAEAVRLLEEVASDYADIPCISLKRRELQALLKDPNPKSNGKDLTREELEQVKSYVAREKTLGQLAGEYLDEINNLGVGSPAPEIDGVDIEGKPLKLSDYRGKFVALVFWGSWCGPCMREVPYEKKLLERLKDKPFAILGVNCADEKDVALKTMKDEGITWPNWYDGKDTDGPINSRYHVRSYPTVVVIDPQGKIAMKGIPVSYLDKYLDEMIAEFEKK